MFHVFASENPVNRHAVPPETLKAKTADIGSGARNAPGDVSLCYQYSFARFMIGHTPRKHHPQGVQPPASTHIVALRFPSKMQGNRSRLIIITKTLAECKGFSLFYQNFSVTEHFHDFDGCAQSTRAQFVHSAQQENRARHARGETPLARRVHIAFNKTPSWQRSRRAQNRQWTPRFRCRSKPAPHAPNCAARASRSFQMPRCTASRCSPPG